jgi:crossover junction endodeoxyribonuclease RusA
VTTHVIVVDKIADYMNANDRPHKAVKWRQTREWRDHAEECARRSGVPPLTGVVRIVATVHINDRRRREVSNLFPTMKAAIDGFVSAGVLADDSDAHVIGPDPRRGYGSVPCIVFELIEIGESG